MIERTPAADWFETTDGAITSRHLLSFGRHYDPRRVRIGPLAACNHERLGPGAGFDDHPHSGVEILTYVVEGAIEHRDSTGAAAVVGAGHVQRLSAASGVRHTERNASTDVPARFVQVWLTTDSGSTAGPPEETGYATAEVRPAPGLVVLADRDGDAPLRLGVPDVRWLLATVGASEPVGLPDAARMLVHVLSGDLTLVGGSAPMDLATGDAAVATRERGLSLATGAPAAQARALVWLLPD